MSERTCGGTADRGAVEAGVGSGRRRRRVGRQREGGLVEKKIR